MSGQAPIEPSPSGGVSALLRDLKTAANIVSLSRIALMYLCILLWDQERFDLGVPVGIVAGLTDYLDGWLARRYNQQTRIGGLLDQAADILFMTGCIFLFVRDGSWPRILLYVVIFREVLVLNLRASAAQMGFSLPSIFLGKWASNWMFYSLALMGISKLPEDPYATWIRYVSHFGMVVGIISSLITAGIYTRSYARQYKP